MAGKQNSVMSDTRLDYDNRFGAHSLHIFGGARVNWETYTLSSQLGYNTASDKMPSISSSLDHAQTSGNSDKWTNIAWYAQAGYNYLQRYYLQASLTAETSSRFGKDAQQAVKLFQVPWGIFPGVEAAWVVSNESWFQNLNSKHSILNYLRLNLGYDVSGNDDLDYHAARSYFASHNFLEDVSGLTFENIGNTQLQWETTRRLNAGIEANLFGNRLNADCFSTRQYVVEVNLSGDRARHVSCGYIADSKIHSFTVSGSFCKLIFGCVMTVVKAEFSNCFIKVGNTYRGRINNES